MRRIAYSLFLIPCLTTVLSAQNSSPVIEGNEALFITDRLSIKAPENTSLPVLTLKPLYRRAVVEAARDYPSSANLTTGDKKDLAYIHDDNTQYVDSVTPYSRPIFHTFFRTPSHLYELKSKYFNFTVDPVLLFKAGYENREPSGLLFDNRRGAEITASVDDKIYLSANVIESQTKFPSWIMEQIKARQAVPGADYYKDYNSRFTSASFDGYDYLTAKGLIGFNITKHVGLEFGHGRNFIGDGYRSLLLSDYGANYFYLKANWRVWRIHYQNIFAELTHDYIRGADQLLPKKYMAAHYLDFKVLNNLHIGLFESVIFSRKDHFEFQYLNPFILYRSIEHALGSPDNIMLGLGGRWNFLRHFSLYGQFALDDLNIGASKAGKGWWGNKYGIQLGAKYIDMLGIDHLDGQLEFNAVRPYTYSHTDSAGIYSHYNQPLAHPLGANFYEVVGLLRYQPIHPLTFTVRLIYAIQGLDTAKSNWGSNIFLLNTTHETDYNNSIGQGVKTKMITLDMRVSYMLWHNMYMDLQCMYRSNTPVDPLLADKGFRSLYLGACFRMNIADRDY